MINSIAVVTLFPALVEAVGQCGVTGRAVDNGLFRISTVNPRDFAADRHRTVDDRPYGGGPGMVMKVQPLSDAINRSRELTAMSATVVYMSPQGEQLNQTLVEELAVTENLILVAGRYEGIDERLISREIDREISIGDYVLSGGELAAMVVIDAIARQVPGVLGHQESAGNDSFAGEGWLDCPHYTRPEAYQGVKVPDVLAGGDHEAIARWRRKQSLGRTWLRRRSLIDPQSLSQDDRQLLRQFLQEHNVSDADG